MDIPDVSYARSCDVANAYQVVGAGTGANSADLNHVVQYVAMVLGLRGRPGAIPSAARHRSQPGMHRASIRVNDSDPARWVVGLGALRREADQLGIGRPGKPGCRVPLGITIEGLPGGHIAKEQR